MKNRKKITAIAVTATAATALLIGGTLAFFVDKDWTSDVGAVGSVYAEIEDLVFTNKENINPGDGHPFPTPDPSQRPGTEHKLSFTVNNVGTKSLITRNLITITVENTMFTPVYYKDGETLYNESTELAPDNRMYFCDYANNTLSITEDELGNKYVIGTELFYNESKGVYHYVDATTGDEVEFDETHTRYRNIVHWEKGNLPADVFSINYDVTYASEVPTLAGYCDETIVVDTVEVDCIPSNGALHTGTDLYAYSSKASGNEFEIFPRNFYDPKQNSDLIAIRYITPSIELAAPEGSIEDADGVGSSQTNASTQGGLVLEGDLDSVYYTYYFAMNKDASNIYNGATVYVDIEVQALQYRNTSDGEWETLFTHSDVLTVENASKGYNSIFN